jgi:two-component system, NtrC family, sensor kinase
LPDLTPQIRSRRGPEDGTDLPVRGRLSLRSRVLLGYLLLLVVFGVVLTAVLVQWRGTHESLAMLSAGYLPLSGSIGGAEAIPLGVELEKGQLPEVLYDRRRAEQQLVGLKQAKVQVARDIAGAMLIAGLDQGDEEIASAVAARLDDVGSLLAEYGQVHGEFVAAIEAAEPNPGAFIPELLRLRREIEISLENLDGRIQRRIRRVVKETDGSQRDARFALTALSSVAFGIGLLLVIATGFMLRPIRQLIAGAERIRDGSFDERVAISSGDEVGRLAGAFNAMAASIQERERHLEERSRELEAALAELRESQAALIKHERLATIGQMAAQIAHEVRNPLNALGLNAEMLADDVTSGNQEEAIETLGAIRDEIARLTEITEAYLALGRLPPLRLDPYPLGALVTELVRFQHEELERGGVTVELALPDGLPEVQVDPAQLRQALLNIVRNAAEALRAGGGGTIRVSAKAEAEQVRLDVADDGPGMETEHVARIFDPFFSTKERGSGLGLPITHQVIEEHGGQITCISSPGEGTTFSIWLPRAQVDR